MALSLSHCLYGGHEFTSESTRRDFANGRHVASEFVRRQRTIFPEMIAAKCAPSARKLQSASTSAGASCSVISSVLVSLFRAIVVHLRTRLPVPSSLLDH